VVGPEGLAAGCDTKVVLRVVPEVALWRRRGAGYYHDHEQATGVVLSGESLHQLTVGMMVASLGRRSPRWEHHGEALCFHRVELLG
jgi:hypothetical protein